MDNLRENCDALLSEIALGPNPGVRFENLVIVKLMGLSYKVLLNKGLNC